jgi:hypothetical protein
MQETVKALTYSFLEIGAGNAKSISLTLNKNAQQIRNVGNLLSNV